MISFADNFQTDRITRGIERIHDHTNAAHKGKNDQHAREIQPDCPKTEAAIKLYTIFFSQRENGERLRLKENVQSGIIKISEKEKETVCMCRK